MYLSAEIIFNPPKPDNHRRNPDYMAMHKSLESRRARPNVRLNREKLRRSWVGRRFLTQADITLLHHNRSPDLLYKVHMPDQPSYYGDMTQIVLDQRAHQNKKATPPKASPTPSAKGRAPAGGGRGAASHGHHTTSWSHSIAVRPETSFTGQRRKRPDMEYDFD